MNVSMMITNQLFFILAGGDGGFTVDLRASGLGQVCAQPSSSCHSHLSSICSFSRAHVHGVQRSQQQQVDDP